MKQLQNLNCKIRFALSRLPYFPVTYRLTEVNGEAVAITWSKVMPFFDHHKGLFNFDLWGWDVPELRFLNKFLAPGMVFLDIGAYHGIYSVVAAKRVFEMGKVYTFEPNPADLQRIKHHIQLNHLSNVVIEPFALSNVDGSAQFHVPVNGVKTVGSLRPSQISRGTLKAITVQIIRLDRYVEQQQLTQIDLIKVDVEGAEMLFLDGASETLKRFQPLLIIEAIDVVCQPWGYSGADLLRRMQDEFGYTLYAFDAWGYLLPHQISHRYPLNSNCNFLAVPYSKVSNVDALILTN